MKSVMLCLCVCFATVLMAAEPIGVRHFGETDGRALATIDGPTEHGDLFFTAEVVRRAEESLLYLNAEYSTIDVQLIAMESETGDHRRFMIALQPGQETVIDLSELPDHRGLMFLSRGSFFATLGDGDQFRGLNVAENVFTGGVRLSDLNTKGPKAAKTIDCDTWDTFSTLTCTSPAQCGSLSATANGVLEVCLISIQPDGTINQKLRLTWGCHTGQGAVGGVLTTSSSCGCNGTALWYLNPGLVVYRAQSICPGDTAFSTWDVN